MRARARIREMMIENMEKHVRFIYGTHTSHTHTQRQRDISMSLQIKRMNESKTHQNSSYIINKLTFLQKCLSNGAPTAECNVSNCVFLLFCFIFIAFWLFSLPLPLSLIRCVLRVIFFMMWEWFEKHFIFIAVFFLLIENGTAYSLRRVVTFILNWALCVFSQHLSTKHNQLYCSFCVEFVWN